MKTLEQFHAFFETDLKPILTELEAQRKKVLSSLGWLALVHRGHRGNRPVDPGRQYRRWVCRRFPIPGVHRNPHRL